MAVSAKEDPRPSLDRIAETVRESGVKGLVLVSGYRPGAVTESGNVSYHARSMAWDITGSEQAMTEYSRFMAGKYGSQLLELIHKDPDGTWWWINNGQPGRRAGNEGLLSRHRDHVHVAATISGLDSISQGNGTTGGGVPGTPTTGVKPGLSNPVGAGTEGVSRVYGFLFGKAQKVGGVQRVLYGVVGVGLVGVGIWQLSKGRV